MEYEIAKFEVSGDTYNIDEWWKEAEKLAVHHDLTMSDRFESQIDEIVKAAEVMARHDRSFNGRIHLAEKKVFEAINVKETDDYSVCATPSFTTYQKRREKEFAGITFYCIDVLSKEEYEAHMLEVVA